MILNKIKEKLLLLLLLLTIFPSYILAYSDYIIPGGENIGIELSSKGVIIVGLYQVEDRYPAKEAGLKVGDMILGVNNVPVSNINGLLENINKSEKQAVIKYSRNNHINTTRLTLYKDANNTLKTGLYVKDSVTGIGTLSFIDPATKFFGALGHEIIEKSTGQILEIKSGSIFESSVSKISRSENGSPGEKHARFYSNNTYGSINKNTNKGVFGNYNQTLPNKKLYKVAQPSEVEIGNAQIMTVLKDNEVKLYDIKITKLNNNNQKTKNILFEIIDGELLEKTGGIVQGMSGSPIIQDEYIVGAITHVVIDNPVKGYGIFITNMLEEAEKQGT